MNWRLKALNNINQDKYGRNYKRIFIPTKHILKRIIKRILNYILRYLTK